MAPKVPLATKGGGGNGNGRSGGVPINTNNNNNRRGSLNKNNNNNNNANRKMRFDSTMDETEILVGLLEANKNPNITTLIFDEIDFDSNLASAVIDLFKTTSKYGRVWDKLNIEFCEGPVDLIVSSATLLDCIKHLFLASDEKQDDVISKFATTLRINTSIQSLWLLIPFTEITADLLGEALAVNDSLDKLSLSGSTWDPDALNEDIDASTMDPMMKNSVAESIDTLETYFTADSSALALAKGLGQNTSIRTLDVSCCSLDDDAMSTILSSLIGHPCLQVLDISRNRCRNVSMAAIGEIIKSDYTQLKHLDIREQTSQEPLDISRLVWSLRNNDSLEVLKLSHNQLTDVQVVELVRALSGNDTLRQLDLQYNQLSDQGLNVLTKHLNELSALSVLLLGGNNIGSEGKTLLETLEEDDNSICTINE